MRDPRLTRVETFFSGTGSSYDAMVHYATLGIDRLWKRRIADLIPPNPRRVLDLACGTGISTLAIAHRYPDCLIVGVELRDEYLAIARQKIHALGVSNVEFVLSRAEDYRSEQSFDCIVSSYFAKYADLGRLTTNMKRMLEDGGLLVMHDFTFPPKPYLERIWRLYFWLLQRIGSRLYPAWREIFSGLPRLIEESRWVDELTETLKQEGFGEIRLEHMTLYGSAIITAKKPATRIETATVRPPVRSLQH